MKETGNFQIFLEQSKLLVKNEEETTEVNQNSNKK
jgi:hypothetical protein